MRSIERDFHLSRWPWRLLTRCTCFPNVTVMSLDILRVGFVRPFNALTRKKYVPHCSTRATRCQHITFSCDGNYSWSDLRRGRSQTTFILPAEFGVVSVYITYHFALSASTKHLSIEFTGGPCGDILPSYAVRYTIENAPKSTSATCYQIYIRQLLPRGQGDEFVHPSLGHLQISHTISVQNERSAFEYGRRYHAPSSSPSRLRIQSKTNGKCTTICHYQQTDAST